MKIAALIIGILGMILGGIGFIVCLALPSMTSGRVSFEEAMLGLIPAAIVFFFAFVITIIGAIFVIKARKAATPK